MKLKLQKVKSYHGAVDATQKKPVVDVSDSKLAETLLKAGYFVAVAEDAAEGEASGDSESDGGVDYEALSKLSKDELTQYAEDNDIDISGCKTKAEILEAVSLASGGCSTMIDLQQA